MIAAEVERLPWGSTLLVGAVLLVGGVALLGTGRRAAAGRLARNPYAGIRIKATLASDAAWIAGHRAAAVPLTVAGAVCVVGGLLVLLHGPGLLTAAGLALAGGGAVVAVAVAAVRARRAALAVTAAGGTPTAP